ncbi:MAG TPA: hypothetical protein VL128_00515 [Candidatus Eisenbacteria bacterium]|nr:hypothetical protein [Candidatus Eisenbacteria bacterium]
MRHSSFASSRPLLYHFFMANPALLPCDGCGQPATPEHHFRRLQRLEWATRFRPIHVQALLLKASSPESGAEFLYTPESPFSGEASRILAAIGIVTDARLSEEVLTDFQKRGLVLASVLECPVEPGQGTAAAHALLSGHLSHALIRIRHSIKPRRVLVLSVELQQFLSQLAEAAVGCPVFYTPLSALPDSQVSFTEEVAAFRAALPSLAASHA